MLDLNRLRHVIAIAREGSYSAAAAAINISQSALTRSIQALEAEYGVKIFERGRSGAKLTHLGATFIKFAEDIVRCADLAHQQLHLTGTPQSLPVRFGMGPVAAASYLPQLLPLLSQDGTMLRIKVESNTTLRLLLRQGEIDFFIGAVVTADEYAAANGFCIDLIKGGHLALAVRAGHPLLSQELTPSALARYPVAAGSFVRDNVALDTLASLGLQLPSIELDDYSALAKMLRQTDHILISSHLFPSARPEFGLVSLPVRCEIKEQLGWGLVTRQGADLSPDAKRVAMLMMHHIREFLLLSHE